MMYFFFAVNIFALIFTSAECNKYHQHSIKSELDCRAVRKGMSTTFRETRCGLRPQLVELKPVEGYIFDPPIVSINQCAGNCRMNACKPMKYRNVTLYVQQSKPSKDHMAQCVTLEVEEHAKCKCQCVQTKNDCISKQIYDANSCSCKCTDREAAKQNCEQKMGMKWIEDICECRCMMMTYYCTTPLKWNHETCKCEPPGSR